jgi:UDP:flavonoid glycosyltransferase YjiC (YdhE family)
MSTIMFFTWAGGGNQPPAIGLAQQLRRCGHEVVFAGYEDQSSQFEALGLEFVTLTRSGAAWQPFDPADLMPLLVQRIWACQDHVADTAELLDRVRPDVVVVDCLMGGVLAAMEGSPIPTLVLVHSSPGALAPPGGPTDALVLNDLNRVRSSLDLPPVDSYWQAWDRHHVLCASIPELDPSGLAAPVPATWNWIGPVFEDLTPTSWASEGLADTPLVLVSFSSTPAWDQTDRISRTIDGLAGAQVRVLVTTGAVDPTRFHVSSPSISVVPYVPHGAVLPYATAVVTHAGHGTLTAALAHGLPIVAIPNLAADQPALAAQTARLGAGIHLADDATPGDIAQAVRTVIDDPTYATNAGKLADIIRGYAQQPLAVVQRELENAAHSSHSERV